MFVSCHVSHTHPDACRQKRLSWTVCTLCLMVALCAPHSAVKADKAASLQACIKTAVNYGDVLSCQDSLSSANLVSPSHEGKEGHGTEINDGINGNEVGRSF